MSVERTNPCPLERVVEMIDGKWKVLILWHLRDGCLRFSELQRKIPGVSQKMLTEKLRQLESSQLIQRTVYPEIPPRVEYTLTDRGVNLKPLLILINDWGHSFFTPSH
ncbi:MAG: winged helix-turn-helix transcriptional regulator [Bacilli bacterium]